MRQSEKYSGLLINLTDIKFFYTCNTKTSSISQIWTENIRQVFGRNGIDKSIESGTN